MATVIKTTFKLRRGLANEWYEVNPILAEGEPGYALDTKVLKIGDGVNSWNNLKSIGGASLDPSKEYYTADEINIIIESTQTSLIGLIEAEKQRAMEQELKALQSIEEILNETTGILAQSKAYTDGVLVTMAKLQVDNDTIKIENDKAYVAKVSTDILEQGECELILSAGSSI